MIPTIEMMSRTAPMSIKILAQFLPVNRAIAKTIGRMASGMIMSPNGPKNAATPSPGANAKSEPTICRIPRIVTPVGLETFIGATGPKCISPHF